MTVHKALHPREDLGKLYVSRKEGGIELARIQDSVETSIQRLKDHIKKRGGRLITETLQTTQAPTEQKYLILSYEQMVYSQPRIRPNKREAQNSLGF